MSASPFENLSRQIKDMNAIVFLGKGAFSEAELAAVFKKYGLISARFLPAPEMNKALPATGEHVAHLYIFLGSDKDYDAFLDFGKEIFSKDPRPYFVTHTQNHTGQHHAELDVIGPTFAGHLLEVPGDTLDDFESTFIHASQKLMLQEGMGYWYRQWEDLKRTSDELNEEAYVFQQEQNEVIRFTKILGEKLVPQDVSKSACHFLGELFKASAVGFCGYDDTTDTLRLEVALGQGKYEPLARGYEVQLRGKRNPIEYFESFVGSEAFSEIFKKEAPDLKFHTEPTYIKNEVVGVFFLGFKPDENQFRSHLLSQLIQYFTISYQNATLHDEISNLATRDGLTLLHNVRYFHERIAAEFNRMERLKHPLGLIFLDIDNFKHYNDTNGHPMGDKVIKLTADLIKKIFRPTDIIARYGGEEFVVALPHANLEHAYKRAAELRELVETTQYPQEESQPLGKVTISIGVSAFPEVANDVKTLLSSADNALYEVKESGRNNVRKATVPEGHVPLFEVRSDYTQNDTSKT